MCLWLLWTCLGMTACTGLVRPRGQSLSSVAIISGGIPPLTPVPTTPGPFTLPGGTTTLPPFPTLPGATTTTTLRPLTPVPTGITVLPPVSTLFPLIDPRFGTPPPLRMQEAETFLKFGGDEAASDVNGEPDVINFPRSKRSVPDRFVRTKRQALNCSCVPPAQCPNTTNGAELIDFRVVSGSASSNCSTGLRFCCVSMTAAQTSCGSRLQSPTSYPLQPGQAKYGDYPWMVVIMTNDNQYIGGGALIDMQNVITTAHRIASYVNGAGIKVRIGEWDLAGTYEQYPYRDFSIARMWIHESFSNTTLQNDLALLRLTGGIPAGTQGVVPVCLPTPGQVFDGLRCWVSGWGQDAFGSAGRLQTILKAVDVPIIPAASCETSFRTTRLGTAYTLDRTAFLCAGAEASKDSCTGDGGSGLVCETSTGRWTVAGLVAWGLGCATQGVPSVYINIVNYIPWIQARQAMTV